MAKQRRPQSKAAKATVTSPAPPGRPAARPVAPKPAAPAAPVRRSTYFEAVALYEKAVAAIQRHDFRGASVILETVVRQYPEEKELQERAALYLNVCRRHDAEHAAAPQSVDERLYASTLALNGGRYEEAITHLRLVRDEDPDNDHALYMLAVAHAQRSEHAEAIAHLERAIALNPENRGLARQDPDFEPLRGDDSFRQALNTPAAAPAADRRRAAVRTRTAR